MYSDKNPGTDNRSRKKRFRRTVKLANIVIAGNSYLAEHVRRFNPSVVVLPTGLDTGAYKLQNLPKKDDKIRLVWIGSHYTLKYLAEIKPVLEEIGLRFENVVLRIICDHFFDLKNMIVEKRRWSPQNQISDLLSSDIGLAPLPDDQFTRGKCGFKILQYAAAGLPVVASPVGVNSEYVRDDVTGLFATNTREWFDRITQLIENRQLREKMGEAGRTSVKNFDVSVIGKQLAELIFIS
jgi:glycosyltransferase involved in cell wall biosynthesis